LIRADLRGARNTLVIIKLRYCYRDSSWLPSHNLPTISAGSKVCCIW